MARFTVTIPDELLPPGDPAWYVTRHLLEAVEPGSSGHCLWSLDGVTKHHRLGVTVDHLIEEAP